MAVTYVVTGATGHIGNNVVRLLADKGERVIAAVRRDNDPALEGGFRHAGRRSAFR